MHRSLYLPVWVLALAGAALPAEHDKPEPPEGPLTIAEAVEFAVRNFPAVRVSAAAVAAAESGVDVAKAAYLPRADMRLGVNRATHNNVFGLIFPNGVIPGISGLSQGGSTASSAFGSSAGVLFSYEPFDLGLRRATVRAAEAATTRAEADRAVTEYEVSLGSVASYLRAVAGRSAVRAAEAGVERMQVFHDRVAALVRSDLRPGADAARARAELARARSDLIRSEQAAASELASLAETLGLAGSAVDIDPRGLLNDPPDSLPSASSVDKHPLKAAQRAEIAVREARLDAIKKELRPRFEAQSAVYGRGTGAQFQAGVPLIQFVPTTSEVIVSQVPEILTAGVSGTRGSGLVPSEGNWAVGFNMSFDLLDYKRNRAKRRVASHRLEQERARKDTVLQELRGGVARAEIAVDAARKIARNTPVELQAAQELETQEQARYKAGLATVADVADAQLLLRRAEVDDALAKVGVWQALFALAAAQGEMDELLAAASR